MPGNSRKPLRRRSRTPAAAPRRCPRRAAPVAVEPRSGRARRAVRNTARPRGPAIAVCSPPPLRRRSGTTAGTPRLRPRLRTRTFRLPTAPRRPSRVGGKVRCFLDMRALALPHPIRRRSGTTCNVPRRRGLRSAVLGLRIPPRRRIGPPGAVPRPRRRGRHAATLGFRVARRRGLGVAALGLRFPLRRRRTGSANPIGGPRRSRCWPTWWRRVIPFDFVLPFDIAPGRARPVPRHRVRSALHRRAHRSRAASRAATGRTPRPRWPRRVVTVQAIAHQPRQQPAQRQVRVTVRQQHQQLLQPMPALRVDGRLQLPASASERAHPVARRGAVASAQAKSFSKNRSSRRAP